VCIFEDVAMTSAHRRASWKSRLPLGAWFRGWFATSRRAKGPLQTPAFRHHRAILEALEDRRLLAVSLSWSGPGNVLNLAENTSGATPTTTISEPTPGVNLLKIDLGAGYVFAAGSTASATGLTYQNAGSPTTSEYATIDIRTAGNVSSLVATLPGDALTVGLTRALSGGVAGFGISRLALAAGQITVDGRLAASDVQLTGSELVTVNGTVQARTLRVAAGVLDNSGELSASGATGGQLSITADRLVNSGQIMADGSAGAAGRFASAATSTGRATSRRRSWSPSIKPRCSMPMP
jgi:adhesin HecA-like repeat protein